MSQVVLNKPDLVELIFADKNKEYGAYKLRKAYNKYVSISMWIAILIVVLVTTGPTIYNMIFPEPVAESRKKIIQVTQLQQPPSIGDQKEVEQIEAPPPLKSTIKFTPPVVKPDEQVKDENIPTVEELKEVDPGLKTEEGSSTGVDYSLIETEEKVVERRRSTNLFCCC